MKTTLKRNEFSPETTGQVEDLTYRGPRGAGFGRNAARAARPRRFNGNLVAAIAGVILAHASFAADWPRWRGPDGTGHVPAAVAVPTALPAEARYGWKNKIGPGFGSPVVSGGTVFYLDSQNQKETVHGVDATSGRPRWSVAIDDTFKDNQTVPGPRSTPVVDGDRVYVQSNRGEFQCLAVADGKLLWRVNFVRDLGAVFTGEKGTTPGAARHGNTGSAVIVGDDIIVAAGGSEGASLVRLGKRDGQVRWKSQSDIPGYGGPVIASPGGVPQVLSFTTQGAIGLRLDTGELLWRVPLKTSFGRHAVSPVVAGDIVLVTSHQIGLLGFRISRQGDAVTAEPAFEEKRLAVNFSSPVVVDDFLYGLGPAGMLFCAEARTGKETWSAEMPGAGKKEHAGFIVMKRNVLVLTEAGELLLVAADPKAFRLVGRLKVAGENWCNPAYADGRVYLRDAEELVCVELLR